jgi:very-short-patch-repair endonuclease
MPKLVLSFPHFQTAGFCGMQMGEQEGGKMPRPPRSDSKTRTRAIELRRASTPAERKLWAVIRNDQLGINFRRQHAVGIYIPDFVCIQKKLILELDGSQHLEQEEYDQERTEYLKSQGYRVIRFWNNDVMKDIDSVILAIIYKLENENRG